MFWIVWCYFGLTVVQVSDTQRRALVNYSYTTATTSSPVNRTSVPSIESSVNSISRSATVSILQRGSSRGESPLPLDKRKGVERHGASAKGDFAVRKIESNATSAQDVATASPQQDSNKAQILNSGNADPDEGIHARRVSTATTHNRPLDAKEDGRREASRPDISPTQVYDYDGKSSRSHRPTTEETVRDEKKPPPREYTEVERNPARRDDIQSSRRSESDPAYRDPDFERDYPRSTALPRDRSRGRYDDEDDVRGSRGRYDKRDRGRDTDDKYSKGDTRVYPDDEPRRTRDRFSEPDRYPDDDRRRRGDDDRDRDLDDRYRDRDRDLDDRYRDRPRSYDDRYRDRDRTYDDRYRDRDVRYRDEDRVRDDGYRPRDEDRVRSRDDDRYRDRIYDVDRDDEYRYRPRGEEERYRPDYREPISSSRPGDPPLPDRKLPLSSIRDDSRTSEYEPAPRDRSRTYTRDDVVESRSRGPSRDSEDRYRDDDYRRPSRYDERDRIVPTRVRDEIESSRSLDTRDRDYVSRSSSLDGRRREEDRYLDRSRDAPRYDDNRRDDETRVISPSSIRRPSDDREEYRTRLPNERRSASDSKYVDRRDEVVLDRRSYASEEDDEYRRSNSRTRSSYDNRDDSRRDYRDDDEYSRRPPPDDDEYRRSRPRGDYDPTDRDYDRSRTRDRYDRDYGRYDRDDDRVGSSSRKYDRDEDEVRRRDPDSSGLRKESSMDIRDRRPITDDDDDRRSYSGTSRYRDETSRSSPRRDSLTGLAQTPSIARVSEDVVIREKRFQGDSRDSDRSRRDPGGSSPERPLSAQDVIEAALRHSDVRDQGSRKVFYPVFDPRVSNLTSPEIIRPSERRGITITSRRRRKRTLRF